MMGPSSLGIAWPLPLRVHTLLAGICQGVGITGSAAWNVSCKHLPAHAAGNAQQLCCLTLESLCVWQTLFSTHQLVHKTGIAQHQSHDRLLMTQRHGCLVALLRRDRPPIQLPQ